MATPFRLTPPLLAAISAVLLLGFDCRVKQAPARKLFPVSGSVTLDAVPLDGATIYFVDTTKKGKSAFGQTDADGRFELLTSIGGSRSVQGALDGAYKIAIEKIAADGKTPLVPKRYADWLTTPLTADVTKDGRNVFTFDLATP
jgi:hypothetical protein